MPAWHGSWNLARASAAALAEPRPGAISDPSPTQARMPRQGHVRIGSSPNAASRSSPSSSVAPWALWLLAACGSSAVGGSVGVDCGLPDAAVLCLESCNLGCSATGCAQTDIAQNQVVLLVFSEDVDPSSVSTSSIRFRTPDGDEPVGEFYVDGRTVRFEPTIALAGGQTFLGFTAGETYTLTIPGGATQAAVVRGSSGRPFAKTLVCALRSSLGIVDANGAPPTARLVVPAAAAIGAAPRETDVVVEFDELVDATPFVSGTQSPVTFRVRRNRETASGSGVYECNPDSPPQTLTGAQVLDFDAARGVSVLTFRPTQPLPGNVCVEIDVTAGVTDLAGRPARPQTFRFRTMVVPLVEAAIVETFADDGQLDEDASAAMWNGGAATFCRIGGDGRHGAFSLALCTDTQASVDGKRVYTLNCDNTVVPAANTTTGSPIAVTDGRFFFTSMVVPSDARVRVVGTAPPQFTVAGRLEVLGDLDVAGASVASVPAVGAVAGQPGGAGGPGAGGGGRGGDKITAAQAASSGATAANQGGNGQDARVLAGHAYATTVSGTGGRGSTVFPASGRNASIYYGALVGTPYSPMAAAGGGGGGFLQPGGVGVVVSNNHPEPGLQPVATAGTPGPTATTITAAAAGAGNPPLPWYPDRYAGRTLVVVAGLGAGQSRTIVGNGGAGNATFTITPPWSTPPDASSLFAVQGGSAPLPFCLGPSPAASAALVLQPFPPASALVSSQHFLVGGAGGGGGASHACLSIGIATIVDRWAPGAGGGGGGGAIALRAGRRLGLAPAARILAHGGSAANSIGATGSVQACVGGGGSGGSVVLQTGRLLQLDGAIDVRGGSGGLFQRQAGASNGAPPAGAAVVIQGGHGAAGQVRLEGPDTPSSTQAAGVLPAATAASFGPLAERDPLVVCASRHYSTGLAFGPEYVRYEVRGTVDGAPFVYSDDPAIAATPATSGVGAVVRVLFQAAQLDLSTGEALQSGPWRAAVRSSASVTGIDAEGWNGFRFRLFADHTLGADISVEELVVVYRR